MQSGAKEDCEAQLAKCSDTLAGCVCLPPLLPSAGHTTAAHLQPHLDLLQLTCLLSAPSGGQGAGPVACSVEGCHADHVGGVARQVLQLHAELRQEQGSQALCLILELELPEIDLQKGFKGRSTRKRRKTQKTGVMQPG